MYPTIFSRNYISLLYISNKLSQILKRTGFTKPDLSITSITPRCAWVTTIWQVYGRCRYARWHTTVTGSFYEFHLRNFMRDASTIAIEVTVQRECLKADSITSKSIRGDPPRFYNRKGNNPYFCIQLTIQQFVCHL